MEKIEASVSTSLLKGQSSNFCAILSESGTQSKRSSHFEDFFLLIGQATIAWLDIKVDNFEKEVAETATKVGFSELLLKQLLTRLADNPVSKVATRTLILK